MIVKFKGKNYYMKSSALLLLSAIALVGCVNAQKAERGAVMDNVNIGNNFPRELARLQETGKLTDTAELYRQACEEKTVAMEQMLLPNQVISAETIYQQAIDSVVIVGKLYKCGRCISWHVNCSSGFVIHSSGLVVVNFHLLETGVFKESGIGIMMHDGRVFAVKSVVAANRFRDLAILKVDAKDLKALPIAKNTAVGAQVYVLSHPMTDANLQAFYNFTSGMVSGKYTMCAIDEKNSINKEISTSELYVTADWAPGSSGAPILNNTGTVVGVVRRYVNSVHSNTASEHPPMALKIAISAESLQTLFSHQ